MNSVADDQHRLVDPFVVQVVDGVLGCGRQSVVVLWNDKDVCIILCDLGAPLFAVFVLERPLGRDHGWEDALIINGEVKIVHLHPGYYGAANIRLLFQGFAHELGDIRADARGPSAGSDEGDFECGSHCERCERDLKCVGEMEARLKRFVVLVDDRTT